MTIMRRTKFIILLTAIVAVLVTCTVGCTKPDRSEEAQKLKTELQQIAFTTPEKAFARIDSAERVGLFSPAQANGNLLWRADSECPRTET